MTFLLQAAARTVHDTIYVATATASQTWFQKVTGVASGVMTLTLMILAVALVPAAWNFRKTYKKSSEIIERIQSDVGPLVKHAHAIADNLNYISTAIRSDVGMIQDTLKSGTARLERGLMGTEQRIN